MKNRAYKSTLTFISAASIAVIAFLITKEGTGDLTPVSKLEPITSERYFKEKLEAKKQGLDRPDLFAEIAREIRTPADRDHPEYGSNYVYAEYLKAKQSISKAQARTQRLDFVERGPGNIGGRTRALLIDPRDRSNATWYAGSASGGIWKTTNAGRRWVNLTQELPNLGTNALAMSEDNPDVIYAGTGEPFAGGEVDGSGMFKSSDGGGTWSQVIDPSDFPNARNITRIIVDPDDADVVLATGQSTIFAGGNTSGVFKSTDGGSTWTEVFTISGFLEDLDSDPTDFNTMYASLNGNRVFKSTDGGITWEEKSRGLNSGQRIELAVSPVNTERLWASVVGAATGAGADLYFSDNGGDLWTLLEDANGNNVDFLGGQGNYDNIVLADPFDEDAVYVGGVNLWRFELARGGNETETIEVNERRTGSFMDFVNFGAAFYGGQLEVGGATPLVSVEIRFGRGTQMAHRFTVDMQGAGVADADYQYQDYVEVPFQVWDVTNNRQLMASFRDQQENGTWELIENNTDGDGSDDSREYLFVHAMDYNEDEPASVIAVDGGHTAEQLYFMWPVLADGGSFDPDDLPRSAIEIDLNTVVTRFKDIENISDAYQDFDGENTFTNAQFEAQEGLHPDQHGLLVIVEDAASEKFQILNGNDGGVYLSKSSKVPGRADESFLFRSFGYNTTQFYGADKAPGEDRYIGGMQDNSTWFTPAGESATASTDYEFAVGGDGFEALWNNRDGNLMMGSVQFNQMARSEDNGETWFGATNGLTDVGQGSGPFVSRLANSKFKPDRVFALGASGVWRSLDFGASWELSRISDSFWAFSNVMDVEVSDKDVDLIWAGAALTETSRLFYSVDGGQTFTPTENYRGTTLGTVSGFRPHPTERRTIFALFSFAGRPKVIKSTDLGKTWTDLSGFEGGSGSSSNGFPDVAVRSILVFPNNTDRIWVGTEIGLVESLDGGDSWTLLDINLPAVSIHDMKIKDDQIVLATYGRGIWTITLPEVEEDVVFAPVLGEVGVSPDGSANFQIDYSEVFDSTRLIVDGEVVLRTGRNRRGLSNESLSNSTFDGNLGVQVISYLGRREFKSDEVQRSFFVPNEIEESYSDNFNSDRGNFIGEGFNVTRPSGFSNTAIHSLHPYPEQTNLIYTLKTPITVSATNPIMTYRDVAIIETGTSGSSFGDVEFWDFVVVEGSPDGVNWTPLADGYDASFDPVWEATYDGQVDGDETMYVDHSIDLTETFDAGTDIFIRFRLFSDPNVVAWGWLIDDVAIQERALNTRQKLEGTFEVFPNPVDASSVVQYSVAESKGVALSVISIDGRVLKQFESRGNQGEVVLGLDGFEPGIYFLRLDTDLGFETKRIFLSGN